MNQIALLVILLAHGGFWFGDHENAIRVAWVNPKAPMPAAVLSWQLTYGQVQLAKGAQNLPVGQASATVLVKLPLMRTATDLVWHYQLARKDNDAEIERGSRTIHAFPDDLLAGPARRLADKRLVVLDDAERLPALLQAADLKHQRIKNLSALDLTPADLLLVGEDQLPADEVVQNVLLDQARAGVGVLVLAQSKARVLAGYPLIQRSLKQPLVFREKHLLCARFTPSELNAWLAETTDSPRALALPADEPILELAWWPRETPGDKPVPIDALITTQTLGRGRIVLFQMQLGQSKDDPRCQLLLANALDYLLSRPEPTLRPSARSASTQPVKTRPAAPPNNLYPLGDQP